MKKDLIQNNSVKSLKNSHVAMGCFKGAVLSARGFCFVGAMCTKNK